MTDICLCLPPDKTWHKVNDLKIDYSEDLGRGRLGTSRSLSPAWLCWSSAHFLQYGPDEPCWTWTQIYVQTCMPDYRLNRTRSSALQRCQWCSSPTRRWPSRSWGPFGLKYAIEHWQMPDSPLKSLCMKHSG